MNRIPVMTLFLVIFLEGYAVLSAELLAIRLIIPFTGSGTDTISIIIAAVLMPLAFGYYYGGRFTQKHRHGKRAFTVRKKLLLNLTVAIAVLTIGLSYSFLHWGADTLYLYTGMSNRIWLTTLYALLFLVYPVYLLGQTVPLISNYFGRTRMPRIAGRVLFYSTIGSFMGSIFCTLVLMTYLGVHHAVSITLFCLVLAVILLSKRKLNIFSAGATLCFLLSLLINSDYAMSRRDIVANNKYHMVQITDYDHDNSRWMKINDNMSSALYKDRDEPYFNYAKYLHSHFIEPLQWSPVKKEILVIGAGGFTIGRHDKRNSYVFLDLDADLLAISEEQFLEEKLGANKQFIAEPARAYLYNNDRKFDLIILDVFRGQTSTPEHLVTREFFQQVKNHLKAGGVMVGNYMLSANFSDEFTVNLDNTMRSVFYNLNRQVIAPYNGWATDAKWVNVIYSYHHNPDASRAVYTDNLNSSHFDKPATLRE